MSSNKTAVSPVRQKWRYCSLALDHRTEITTGMGKHIHCLMWAVITHPCPNFNSSLTH